MENKEFRPLPEEFNLGYKPPVKEEEEEEKKKRRKKLRRLITMAAAVLIILPLTLNTGLFQKNGPVDADVTNPSGKPSQNTADGRGAEDGNEEAPVFREGSYVSGNTYVHLENGCGWFFNGEYFIPLRYDPENLTYRASGAYPESADLSLVSTVYYVSSEGDIGVGEEGLRLYDPFRQESALFKPAEAQFNTAYIDHGNSLTFEVRFLFGNWKGSLRPQADRPMAYLTDLVLSPDGALQITAADTATDNTRTYSGSWTLEDGILKTDLPLPLEYEIVTEENTVSYRFEQMPEGILFFREDGCYLYLNFFASQLFVR